MPYVSSPLADCTKSVTEAPAANILGYIPCKPSAKPFTKLANALPVNFLGPYELITEVPANSTLANASLVPTTSLSLYSPDSSSNTGAK